MARDDTTGPSPGKGRPGGGPVAPEAALATVIPLPNADAGARRSRDPIVGPLRGDADSEAPLVVVPRLARHEIVLDDEHRVGVAVCGQGLPVVLVHGFTAEGILYAQTLSRLVRMGFKVVAIDVAGHGGTQGLPTDGANLDAYVRLLGRVLDELGIRRAVFAGHSMGGRLVAQLAAENPDRAIAVILIDAAVGDLWDKLIGVSRFAPPVLLAVAALLALDTLSTLPWLSDPRQAAKLGRLVVPTLVGHAVKPWRLLGPAISLLRSQGTGQMLEELADSRVPVVVIHGDRDVAVPYRTAVDAARRSNGTLVTIRGGTHSWVLKDPETLPAVVAQLLDGPLARVRAAALGAAGLRPDATTAQIEDVFLGPHAWVRRLTPPLQFRTGPEQHRPARYTWTVDQPGSTATQTAS
ncbi:MAG TPA: alpha/beta fold hydrolase [Acidimicrobiales bacterium]|nr:alpha/beta fold hydrolase [Acidimicrobiales bacterium]